MRPRTTEGLERDGDLIRAALQADAPRPEAEPWPDVAEADGLGRSTTG